MIDVSDILNDPELGAEFDLVCIRNTQDVGNDGRAINYPSETQFIGVVTNVEGDVRDNTAEGSRITGSILIHSQFELVAADDDSEADIVQRANGRQYTVVEVINYKRNGVGFVAATCTPRRSRV